ncbi:MAG: glycine--tRNA ligase [Acidobacteria bacterium]|nr:MAG: glycine--tRNA ligase [Acidobacteriota bacterium]REK02513.1 MAG: glycine--tRNA ligase [Acidobacteriota bacterium]REK13685.1 MAG: glycine--tRNA ligase [Acidobacteriota bacterium]REK41679.1 MAG: glycine--tRNA ligase [Acidobacteriota bacterium]
MSASSIETIVNLSKRRGFVYPASEIYGGLGSAWDYGPLGVELANNIKQHWWKWMVHDRDDIEGIDSSIIQNRLVWKYCGHEDTFNDMLTDCRTCKKRFRADKLEDSQCELKPSKHPGEFDKCDLTEPRPFLTMLSTRLGAVADDEDYAAMAYLRPETAQGIFINFGNILTTSRRKLPFGIAQIGKSFRNEITPGNFILRTREFEQMEMEYFCRPEDAPALVDEWVENYLEWMRSIGISDENISLYEVPEDELAHYSVRTVDVMYRYFPEREDEEKQWDELMGIANRTDFDTRAHSKKSVDEDGNNINPESTEDLSYFDPHTQERFYPYVVEPAIGVNRTLLAVLMDAYTEKETDRGENRVILQLKNELAPIKVAILPLKKNHDEIVGLAHRIRKDLSGSIRSVYDDTGSIGKLYARQDEVGTPFCITVDFDSLEDQTVTVRDRDTWEQERVNVDRLREYLSDRLE